MHVPIEDSSLSSFIKLYSWFSLCQSLLNWMESQTPLLINGQSIRIKIKHRTESLPDLMISFLSKNDVEEPILLGYKTKWILGVSGWKWQPECGTRITILYSEKESPVGTLQWLISFVTTPNLSELIN